MSLAVPSRKCLGQYREYWESCPAGSIEAQALDRIRSTPPRTAVLMPSGHYWVDCKAGVYRLYFVRDSDGVKAVYIGKAASLCSRLRQHTSGSKRSRGTEAAYRNWFRLERVDYYPGDSESVRVAMEKALIYLCHYAGDVSFVERPVNLNFHHETDVRMPVYSKERIASLAWPAPKPNIQDAPKIAPKLPESQDSIIHRHIRDKSVLRGPWPDSPRRFVPKPKPEPKPMPKPEPKPAMRPESHRGQLLKFLGQLSREMLIKVAIEQSEAIESLERRLSGRSS